MNTEHFKQKLEAELTLVEKQLGELGWKNPETGEFEATDGNLETMAPTQDSNEFADQLEEYSERQGGTYGTCEVGAEIIEEERLEANPAARTCMAHME